MMPVQDVAEPASQSPGAAHNPNVMNVGENVNYKKKYKALKRKMKMLVYEQECFTEELKKAQRKLLKVSRDRSFLLDRLIKYEKLDDSSDDTDATGSSDSDGEIRQPIIKRKKLPNQTPVSLTGAGVSLLPGNLTKQQASWLMQVSGAAEKAGKSDTPARRKTVKTARKPSKVSGSGQTSATGHMTREELERHLEAKQSSKPQYMSVEMTHSLPEDIFSHDNSNQDAEFLDLKKEEITGLSMMHFPS